MRDIYEILKSTKKASMMMPMLSMEKKNEVLLSMAQKLESGAGEILSANALDVAANAERLGEVMTDRLRLDEKRIRGMADGIREVALLPDPVGKILEEFIRPNGMTVSKVSVPLGVVGIIYESRPNVTSDAAALCFKSGNACVLRCGKEAFETSKAIIKQIKLALCECGVDEDCVNMPSSPDRESANALMQAVGLVDVLIPRGGAGLIKACVENSKVPCIQTGTGICHVYVDDSADLDKAENIVYNAKTSRPSVCNAEEVLLVHESVASEFLPRIKRKLVDERKASGMKEVELRLCEKAATIIDGTKAGASDFDTEFLDYILAVKVVSSVDEAIAHIAEHSTHHSECIVTKTEENANRFTLLVDSSSVYVNVSTRFTDGGEFGKGCEIGISTQKMHARGPMGLEELTSYKYVVRGNGQVR